MADWLLIGILAIVFLYGWQRGLISSLIGVMGTAIAFFLAWGCKDMAGKWLGEAFHLEEVIAAKVAAVLPMPDALAEESANFYNLGGFYTWVEDLHLPQWLRLHLIGSMEDAMSALESSVYANMLDIFSQVISSYILTGLVFVVLWFLLAVGIRFGSKLLVTVVHHTPLIGKADRLLGAVIMTAAAILCLAVLYHMLEAVIALGAINGNRFWIFWAESGLLPWWAGWIWSV